MATSLYSFIYSLVALAALVLLFSMPAAGRPVTVLVPSQPSIEPGAAPKAQENPQDPPMEVDILMSLMETFENRGVAMDMPKLFASFHYPDPAIVENPEPERTDLLGDVEEIRYLEQKAWGANVGLSKPGLYQFILEARPWWDAERGAFSEEFAKVILPVLGVENGWNMPTGMLFEIIPVTRPFGLTAPALFTGQAVFNGKPLANIPVYMGRINATKAAAPTAWHRTLEARTDANGQFSFILNQPGWWYCEATTPADPLKGPDGEPKPAERAAILWMYVDPQPSK